MAKRRSQREPSPRPAGGTPRALLAAVLVIICALLGTAVWVAKDRRRRRVPPPGPEVVPPASRTPGPDAPAAEPAPRPEPTPRPEPAPRPEPRPEPNEPPLVVHTPPAPVEDHARSVPRGPTEAVTCTQVIDGDTLILTDERRVRLIGINTPERNMILYTEARAALQALCEGRPCLLEYDQERRDTYGRTLAYVYVGDVFANGEIARLGLAYCYAWEPNLAKTQELVVYLRQARAASRGLWGLPAPAPAGRYLARSHHFHREGCARLRPTSEERGDPLEFTTRNDAFDAGLCPCTGCNP